MRRFHLIALVSLLILVATSCGGRVGPSPSPTTTSLEVFRSAAHGFRIAWDARETHVAKRGAESDDVWQLELENLADSGKSVNGRDIPLQGIADVRVVRLASPVPQSSLDTEWAKGLTRAIVKQALRRSEEVKIVTPFEPVTVNGVPFLHATYLSKTEQPFWIHDEVYITTDGSRIFSIHLSADQDAWRQHEGQALKEILGSFQLL